MPTYEYQCQDCGRKTEYFQSITEPALTVCPECNGKLLRLVSAGAGLIFKGSGFYITDYKKASATGSAVGKGKPVSEKKDDAPAPAAESKPTTSETKPAASADAPKTEKS